MFLLILIFFTSLGSVVATSDCDSSHILEDISESTSKGLENPILNENLKNVGLNEDEISSDDLEDIDQSYNLWDDSKNEDILSSTLTADDSSANNDIILTKSQGVSSLLSSPKTIIIEDASHYDSSINEYIQGFIDGAEAGSTLQFTGSSYENIYLRISKPLNIISKSGTKINNIFNVPVFTISTGGSGTNISGFTANLPGSFVEARDVSNIVISGNKISTKRSGIVFNEVYDSFIKNNVFSSFKIAMDISNSGGIVISKNMITPKDGNNIGISLKEISSKKGIRILNNNITASDRRIEATAIYFGRNACNILVKQNIIRKWYTAIDFPYSVNNVSIINNTITDNGDGVIINGWINNFTFNKNLVTGNGRVGVLFDDNFFGTKGNLTLENNFFSHNGVMDLQNKGDKAVSIGKNFAKNRCYRVGMKYGFKIRSRQSGGKYYFSVVDKYGNAISDLPNFSAKLTVNGKSYTVTFIDGKAYVNGVGGKGESSSYLDIGEDNRNLNQWGQFEEIGSDEMSYYEELFNQLAGIASKDDDFDDSDDYSDEYNNESGSGDSGVSNGANSINANGVLSGSSGLAGSPSATSSPSASPSSSPSSAEDASSIKSLSVDEETFRVVGVAGLVLLIILVIGLYYREDILEMMKEE